MNRLVFSELKNFDEHDVQTINIIQSRAGNGLDHFCWFGLISVDVGVLDTNAIYETLGEKI